MDIQPIQRDANGLVPGVEYKLDQFGMIDWRKMIKPEFLVPNKRVFEKRGIPIPNDISTLDDRELLILLGGIKHVAKLRGYRQVEYQVTSPSSDYVAVVCKIVWIPNFETEGKIITFSGIADAHPGNTDSLGSMYLCAIAENRAFVRCVRNFLNINIVGQDEICSKSPEEVINAPVQTSPTALLEKLMSEKRVSFSDIKNKLIAEKVKNAEGFNSLEDIPKTTIFELIERLNKKKS